MDEMKFLFLPLKKTQNRTHKTTTNPPQKPRKTLKMEIAHLNRPAASWWGQRDEAVV